MSTIPPVNRISTTRGFAAEIVHLVVFILFVVGILVVGFSFDPVRPAAATDEPRAAFAVNVAVTVVGSGGSLA